MPSSYDRRRDLLVRTVDRRYEETVSVVPRDFAKRLTAAATPARATASLIGVLRLEGAKTDTGGRRRNWNATVSGTSATFSIAAGRIPAGTELKNGDFLIAEGRAGNPRFEIMSVDYSQITRVVIALGSAS